MSMTREADNSRSKTKQQINIFVRKSRFENLGQETVKNYERNFKQTSILSREISSHNVFHFLQQKQLGISIHDRLKKSLVVPYTRSLSTAKIYSTASPFDRRVTCIKWHPTAPTQVAASSHNGDIILWDYDNPEKNEHFIRGGEVNDTITELKFCPEDCTKIYTSSVNGQLRLQDFKGRHSKVYLDTMNIDHWYCTVDVCARRDLLFTGDNKGNGVMLTTAGTEVFKIRMHKSKLQHAEFNPQCDWLLVTASNDKTVRLWDIRNIKSADSALHVIKHDAPINSAYFNRVSGSRLVTTAQNSEFRVYEAPDWGRAKLAIKHPHRQFQHITSIKAQWHPLHDLIVIGRYPDPKLKTNDPINDQRTIDVYDGITGGLVCQLLDPNASGIVSLNEFSADGEKLASGMGYHVLIWAHGADLQSKRDALLDQVKRGRQGGVGGAGNAPGSSRPRQTRGDNQKKGKGKTTVARTKVREKSKK